MHKLPIHSAAREYICVNSDFHGYSVKRTPRLNYVPDADSIKSSAEHSLGHTVLAKRGKFVRKEPLAYQCIVILSIFSLVILGGTQ